MCKYHNLDKAINNFKQDFKGVSTWHDAELLVQENFPGTKNIFTKHRCILSPVARLHSVAQYVLHSTHTKCSGVVSEMF